MIAAGEMHAPSRAQRVLDLLRKRRGPHMAITASAIAGQLFGDRGLDRQVRLIIAELIQIGGHGEILATTGGEAFPGSTPGYFWAETWQQAQAYYDVLVSRLEEIRKRMDGVWAARQRLRDIPPPQPSLGLDGDPARPQAAAMNPKYRWGFDPSGGRRR
jgi:hypothetical protein